MPTGYDSGQQVYGSVAQAQELMAPASRTIRAQTTCQTQYAVDNVGAWHASDEHARTPGTVQCRS
jgi:hypothetical protein